MVGPCRPWELLFPVEVKAALLEGISDSFERQILLMELLSAKFDSFGWLEHR